MHVISASRRTDIPAFYTEWLLARLAAGSCQVANPFNGRLTTVSLRADDVLALVLWSKHPRPLLPHLERLRAEGYPVYFQLTLNGYGPLFEPGLPTLSARVDLARELADRLGPNLVVWRYDPIVETTLTPWEWHLERFAEIAHALDGAVRSCVISFVNLYRRTRLRFDSLAQREGLTYRFLDINPTEAARSTHGRAYALDEMAQRGADLAAVASAHGLQLQSCCGPALGLEPARCIDPELVAAARGEAVALPARASRTGCGCVAAIDIGAYETCAHGCGSTYCYAVQSHAKALANRRAHDPAADTLAPSVRRS